MVKQTSLDPATPPVKSPEDARLEDERMREIQLLLQQLLEREEITVRIILDCLYDVGTANVISQRVSCFPLQWLMKRTTRISKPAFRILAWRWVKQNCPPIITKWLRSKVQFKPPLPKTKQRPRKAKAAVLSQATAVVKLEDYNQEIQRLNSQVQVLSTLLVGMMTVTLGGVAIVWSIWQEQGDRLPPLGQLQTILVRSDEPPATVPPGSECDEP